MQRWFFLLVLLALLALPNRTHGQRVIRPLDSACNFEDVACSYSICDPAVNKYVNNAEDFRKCLRAMWIKTLPKPMEQLDGTHSCPVGFRVAHRVAETSIDRIIYGEPTGFYKGKRQLFTELLCLPK